MLESLINGDKKQAEEIFHELVVGKSREIYENLLDDDIQVDEASDDAEEEDDEEVEEGFDMQEIGGDPTDDMVGDMGMDDEEGMDDMGGDDEGGFGDDMGGTEPATKDDVLDIKDALDELKAEFEAMLAGEDAGEEDMGDEEGEEDMGDEEGADDFGADDEEEPTEDLVREYVEKVAPAKMGDNGANARSIVAGKNDMGGTTANIARGGSEAGVEANKGQLKGNGLLKGTTTDLKTGNVNTPGSKNATKLSSVANGHGAEKKGAGEKAANTRSIVGK